MLIGARPEAGKIRAPNGSHGKHKKADGRCGEKEARDAAHRGGGLNLLAAEKRAYF